MASPSDMPLGPHPDGAGPYTITVYGRLGRHWEPELRMLVTYTDLEGGTVTVLTGELPDQAALLGALGRLAMWGYVILQVCYEVGLGDQGCG